MDDFPGGSQRPDPPGDVGNLGQLFNEALHLELDAFSLTRGDSIPCRTLMHCDARYSLKDVEPALLETDFE